MPQEPIHETNSLNKKVNKKQGIIEKGIKKSTRKHWHIFPSPKYCVLQITICSNRPRKEATNLTEGIETMLHVGKLREFVQEDEREYIMNH